MATKTTIRWTLSTPYNDNDDYESSSDEYEDVPQMAVDPIGRRLSSPGITGSFRNLRRLSLFAARHRSRSSEKNRRGRTNRSMSTLLGIAGAELTALADIKSRKSISARSVSTDDTTGTPFRFRVVILGQGSVGKTAIVNRFLDDSFTEAHRETVEDLHSRIYRVNGVKLHAELLDTAGNLSFPAMRRISIANANAFLLVYSIVDRQSFATVKNIVDEICQVRKSDLNKLALVIAGNMADLSEKRQISASHVTQWLIEHPENLVKASHLEVSAKTGYQVRDAFRDIIRLSGLLDEFAAVAATTAAGGDSSHHSERTKRRFSFGKPLFLRTKSFGSSDEQNPPPSNGSVKSAAVPPSGRHAANGGRFRRQRTKSSVGTEDHCEDCAVQ